MDQGMSLMHTGIEGPGSCKGRAGMPTGGSSEYPNPILI